VYRPGTLIFVAFVLALTGPFARGGLEGCLAWKLELEAAPTLEARIEVYRRLARSFPESDASGPGQTFCLTGGCATVTKAWFFRLREAGIDLKPVKPEATHHFLIDPAPGRGREIIWDGTYLQFVQLPPEELGALPRQFVGTAAELREFFARHWQRIDPVDLDPVPPPRDLDAFMSYYYLSGIPEGRRMPNFYEDWLRRRR
jgi:hypothetical protein